MRAVVENITSGAHLTCPDNKVIKTVEFASFGDPYGVCGTYAIGKCNAPNALKIAEQVKRTKGKKKGKKKKRNDPLGRLGN